MKSSFIGVITPLFFNFVYPKKMEGSIDCLGNISVKVVSYSLAIFKTMPEEFYAEVSGDGTIVITTQKRSADYIQNHKRTIHKIISSLAFDSEIEMTAFFDTKKKLLPFIEEERGKL